MTAYTLQLQRVPDARRAPIPVFHSLFFAYSALLLGSPLAAGLALFNAVLLRAWLQAVTALAVGALGFLSASALVEELLLADVSVPVAVLLLRMMHVVLGAVLSVLQHPYVRGHLFMDGTLVPILPAFGAAFVAAIALPRETFFMFMGIVI